MPLRFHWRLLQGGERAGVTRAVQSELPETALPDLDAQIDFCRKAEEAGIESLLVDINFAKPDPVLLATALSVETERIRFMIAVRSGLISPTLLVQQVNTFSVLTGGRISLNVVAGHSPEEQRYYGDHLPHDERYARTAEFLAICHGFWRLEGPVTFQGKYFDILEARLNTPFQAPGRSAPELFIGGGSDAARDLAIQHGSCWMRMADTPETVARSVAPVIAAGKEAGLRLCVILRPTREEAVEAAHELVRGLVPETDYVRTSDSSSIHTAYESAATEWLTPFLWTGAVRTHGAPSMALVGSPEEVASSLLEYGRAGISHFILSGWPKQEAMVTFGREILPLVREKERRVAHA